MNSTNIVTYFENSSNFTYDLHPPKSIVPNRPKHCSFTGSSIQHLHQGWETARSLGFFASWEAMPMSQSLKYPRSQNRGHQNEHLSSTYHQISNMKVGFGGFFSMGRDCFQMVSPLHPVQWWQVQRPHPSGYASCIAKWPCTSAPYIQIYFKKTGKDPCFAITYD